MDRRRSPVMVSAVPVRPRSLSEGMRYTLNRKRSKASIKKPMPATRTAILKGDLYVFF
jgi:hypothetical protein